MLKRIFPLCGVVCWEIARGMHARSALRSACWACMRATRFGPPAGHACTQRASFHTLDMQARKALASTGTQCLRCATTGLCVS